MKKNSLENMEEISLDDIFEEIFKKDKDRENKDKETLFTYLNRMKKEANENGFKSFIGFINYGKNGGCSILGNKNDILCSIQNAILSHRKEKDMWIEIAEVILKSIAKITINEEI